MWNDALDLYQLAGLLGRDARELSKLANRGHVPGRKVGGKWRFASAEILRWIETSLPQLSDRELRGLDPSCPEAGYTPLLSALLPIECIELDLPARTRDSVLRELVELGAKSHRIWDPAAILEAVEVRESAHTTARPEGYAIPHPRRRLPNTLGESVIAFGRTSTGIAFGAECGALTDLFFLVCCNEDGMHLRVLARLARILRHPGLLDELREAQTRQDAWDLLVAAETAILV